MELGKTSNKSNAWKTIRKREKRIGDLRRLKKHKEQSAFKLRRTNQSKECKTKIRQGNTSEQERRKEAQATATKENEQEEHKKRRKAWKTNRKRRMCTLFALIHREENIIKLLSSKRGKDKPHWLQHQAPLVEKRERQTTLAEKQESIPYGEY
jgi:hypothetical protein